MAVVVTDDDSDGWYDPVAGPIVNHSQTTLDAAICNGAAPALGPSQGLGAATGAEPNDVDHTRMGQTSILRFTEANRELAGSLTTRSTCSPTRS